MNKDTIIQFVCFITELKLELFANKWEHYSRKLQHESTLWQQEQTTSRFRYISMHQCQDDDFHFSLVNEKQSDSFPQSNVRAVLAGGYIMIHSSGKSGDENNDTSLIAFISHNETDIDYYRNLPLYTHLSIYQAYYESCSYGYVLEFIVQENDSNELLRLIQQRETADAAGIYKATLLPYVK